MPVSQEQQEYKEIQDGSPSHVNPRDRRELVELFLFNGREGTHDGNFNQKFKELLYSITDVNSIPYQVDSIIHSQTRYQFESPEIFALFFLGSILTLPYTNLMRRLNIESIYIRPVRKDNNVQAIEFCLIIKQGEETFAKIQTVTISPPSGTIITPIIKNNYVIDKELRKILLENQVDLQDLDCRELQISISLGDRFDILQDRIHGLLASGAELDDVTPFYEVKKDTALMVALEDRFTTLMADGKTPEEVMVQAKRIVTDILSIFNHYKGDLQLIPSAKTYQAFIFGAMKMNFKARYTINCFINSILGKDFVPFVFSVNHRSESAIPILVKFGEAEAREVLSDMKKKGYAQAILQLKPMIGERVLIGVSSSDNSIAADFAKIPVQENLFNRLVSATSLFRSDLGDTRNEKNYLKQLLQTIYFSIVDFIPMSQNEQLRGRDTEHKNYLSRFIIGQLIASSLNNIQKYVFIPESNDKLLIEKGAMFVLKKRGMVIVFKVQEGSDSLERNISSFLGLKEGTSYVLITIRINPEHAKYGFTSNSLSYCEGITFSREEVPNLKNIAAQLSEYKGKLQEINCSFKLPELLEAVQGSDSDRIKAQFSKLKEDLLPIKALVNSETDFQAILQGISMGTQDFTVLTEINYSPAGRPDLSYHSVADLRPPVLVELKYFPGHDERGAVEKLKQGKEQVEKNSLLRAATKQETASRVVVQFNSQLANTIAFDLAKKASVPHTSESDSELSKNLFKAIRNKVISEVAKILVSPRIDINMKERQKNKVTPLLHLAVKKNFAACVELILENKNLRIDLKDDEGRTALYIAAERGYYDLVEALINRGADVNIPDTGGSYPLLNAIEHSKFDIVSRILGADNVDVNVADRVTGDTALHAFVNSAEDSEINFNFAKQILERESGKVNVYARNVENISPLQLVNNVKMTELLLSHGAIDNLNSINNEGETVLHLMAYKDNPELELLKFLIEKGAFVDVEDNTKKTAAMLYAEKQGEDSPGNKLLKLIESLWVTIKENQPSEFVIQLQAAVSEGVLTTVLKARNKSGLTAYHLAAAKGYLPILKWLNLDRPGPEDEIFFETAESQVALQELKDEIFFDAVENQEKLQELKIALRHQINAQDNMGRTALHWAALIGNEHVVKYLVGEGANTRIQDKKHKTPLQLVENYIAKNKKAEETHQAVKDLLSSINTQRIESKKSQQQAFMRIEKSLAHQLPGLSITPINQGLYLPSFEKRKIHMEGQCTSITRGFSQSLFLGKQQLFLEDLRTSAVLYERMASGQAISPREEAKLFALSRLLDSFKAKLDFPDTSSLSSSLSPVKSVKLLDDLAHYIGAINDDFAIHLVTGNHVLAIYRRDNCYSYFDSNVAWITNMQSPAELIQVVRLGIDSAGYEIPTEGVLIEHFDVTQANQALSAEDKAVLERSIETERDRLEVQDKTLGPIEIAGKKLYRTTLYDMGAKLQLLEGPNILIHSGMKGEDIKANLLTGKMKIAAADYLRKLQGRSEESIREILRATASINFSGTKREIKIAKTIQALIPSEKEKLFNTYELNKLLEAPFEGSLKALPYYLARATARHSSGGGRLFTAAGRLSMTRGMHSIVHAGLSGNEKEFYLGAGEMSFSFLSGLIEDGIVKFTPEIIKRLKLGIYFSRGVGGLISSPFDVYDLVQSAIDLSKAETGSRQWRDGIAAVTFSSLHLVSSVAFTVMAKPGVGTVVGLLILTSQGVYAGIVTVEEFRKYQLSDEQNWRLFWHAFALQPPPEDLQIIAARTKTAEELYKEAREYLELGGENLVAYGIGLGEITLESRSKRSLIGHQLQASIHLRSDNPNATDPMNLPQMLKALRGEAKIPYLKPSYGLIGMNKKNKKHFKLVLISDVCVPNEIFKFALSSAKSKYECGNAVVISDPKRRVKKNVYTDMKGIYSSKLINKGKIEGSDDWKNEFLIEEEGEVEFQGGNNTINLFRVNHPGYTGRVFGGKNSRNILDTSGIEISGLTYDNQEMFLYRDPDSLTGLADGGVIHEGTINPVITERINHFIGSGNRIEEITCSSQEQAMLVDCKGARSGSDAIRNCKQVVLYGGTFVEGGLGEYTLYIKPNAGYASIQVSGTGKIIFPETRLLADGSLIYDKDTNKLSIAICNFTLDVFNYLNTTTNAAQFNFIDRYGSLIHPSINPEEAGTQRITSFHLQSEIDPLTTEKEISMEKVAAIHAAQAAVENIGPVLFYKKKEEGAVKKAVESASSVLNVSVEALQKKLDQKLFLPSSDQVERYNNEVNQLEKDVEVKKKEYNLFRERLKKVSEDITVLDRQRKDAIVNLNNAVEAANQANATLAIKKAAWQRISVMEEKLQAAFIAENALKEIENTEGIKNHAYFPQLQAASGKIKEIRKSYIAQYSLFLQKNAAEEQARLIIDRDDSQQEFLLEVIRAKTQANEAVQAAGIALENAEREQIELEQQLRLQFPKWAAMWQQVSDTKQELVSTAMSILKEKQEAFRGANGFSAQALAKAEKDKWLSLLELTDMEMDSDYLMSHLTIDIKSVYLTYHTKIKENAYLANRYAMIAQSKEDYIVYGKVKTDKGATQAYSVFGGLAPDIIPLADLAYAQGGEGADIYHANISNKTEPVFITIDNKAKDKELDALYIAEMPSKMEIRACDLLSHLPPHTINIKDYFLDDEHGHLTWMDNSGQAFIVPPLAEGLRCDTEDRENSIMPIQPIPFFPSTESSPRYLITEEKMQTHPMIAMNLMSNKTTFYYHGSNLVVMGSNGKNQSLTATLLEFYTTPNEMVLYFYPEQFSVNLTEMAKVSLNYEEVEREVLEDNVHISIVPFAAEPTTFSTFNDSTSKNNTTISLPRVNVLEIPNVTPEEITLSSSTNNLILNHSNQIIILEDWGNTTNNQRVSLLIFPETSDVIPIGKYYLNQTFAMKSLLKKTAYLRQAEEALNALAPQVVNGILYFLAANNAANKRIGAQRLLGFSSDEDMLQFIAAYRTDYSNKKVLWKKLYVDQIDQTIKALTWILIRGGLLSDPLDYRLFKDCFSYLANERVLKDIFSLLNEGTCSSGRISWLLRSFSVQQKLKQVIETLSEEALYSKSRKVRAVSAVDPISNVPQEALPSSATRSVSFLGNIASVAKAATFSLVRGFNAVYSSAQHTLSELRGYSESKDGNAVEIEDVMDGNYLSASDETGFMPKHSENANASYRLENSETHQEGGASSSSLAWEHVENVDVQGSLVLVRWLCGRFFRGKQQPSFHLKSEKESLSIGQASCIANDIVQKLEESLSLQINGGGGYPSEEEKLKHFFTLALHIAECIEVKNFKRIGDLLKDTIELFIIDRKEGEQLYNNLLKGIDPIMNCLVFPSLSTDWHEKNPYRMVSCTNNTIHSKPANSSSGHLFTHRQSEENDQIGEVHAERRMNRSPAA